MSNPSSSSMYTETEIVNAIKEKPSLPVSSGEGEGEGEIFPMSEGEGEIFPMSEGEREICPMSEFSMSSGEGEGEGEGMGGGEGMGEGEGETFAMSESLEIMQGEGECMNGSVVTEAISPNLFRVMRIVPDKQDYSFVEKVQLPDDEILSLCNRLVPSSASAYLGNPPRVRINFNALNQLCLPTVGFYGDKKMMISIFRKESLVDESVLAKMEGRLFEPGFYVSVPENAGTVIVFYWHEGEHFKEASRKDASCNFIRYLVELCGSVYICVEGKYPFEALAASATNTSSKAKRTRRIQVSSVKNSENDLELLSGFSLRIDEGPRNKKSSLAPSPSNSNTRVVFCEGYHHCCFLTAEDRAPRTSTVPENVPVKIYELGNMLKRWSSESNIDYSRLSNPHIITLLQYSHRQEYADYCKLKESFEVTESAIKSAQTEEFKRCFVKVLPEFCNHVVLFVGGETSGTKDQDMEIDADRFEQLHRELSTILTDDDGDQRVVLFGSDIKFICSDRETYMITLESRGQGKKTLPFVRYEEEVDVKCSSQCSCSVNIDAKAKILRPDKGNNDLPFSGERVKIIMFSKIGDHDGKEEMEGIIEVVNNTASLSAIRSWVENIVPVELKSLERNIAFTAFLLSRDQHVGLTFMEKHLKSLNIQSLSPEIQSLLEEFQNAHLATQPTIDREALLSHETLKTVCCQVYKEQEHKFLQNIKDDLSSVLLCPQASKEQEQKPFAIIRDIGDALMKNLIPGKKENLKEQRLRQVQEKDKRFKQANDRFVRKKIKQFKQAEDRFVEEWKRKMSLKNKTETLVTRYMEEVAVRRQSTPRTRWSYPEPAESVELMVKVSVEEEHQFTTVWKACELTPMKKDINDLNSNSGRPIVPTRGESVELVAINPEHERLFKVVVLKSGELLVFIHNFKDSCLNLYRCPKLGFNINDMCPIHTVRRGFDLLAVDESTRSMALYEKAKSKIAIYKFDESFRKVYWTGVDINLESYKGSKILTWMHLIPGKMELLLVDDTNRVRVAEIREKPMMKAKHIALPLQQPPLKACVSVDGFFFIIFRELQGSGDDVDDVAGKRHSSRGVGLEIYVLGDTMRHLKTIPLDAQASRISDLEQIGTKITSFGSQSQLLVYNPVDAPGFITAHVLKTALAKEVVQLQQVSHNKAPEVEREETEIVGSCPYLGYIYHIFDKFATSPALFPDYKKSITFRVVLESSRSDPSIGGACIKYLEALIRQLKASKDKDLSNMKIHFQVDNAENYLISDAAEEQTHVKMGMWVRKLLCLVPIQIARAENNAMVALKDGLQIPHDISYVDSVSLANSIRFGFYDTVLNSWKGKIKVISSMGKQSSGKSYLLNHLSGSLLDVAGGRCTDGVWMTVTTGEDGDGQGDGRYLYVLLDFEGLGSFERSEQEDMLLSVLNAAVSNLTIFNKKDFHLDKDTESAFSRFQSGINLLKQDKKLFKGLFYIAIKDVDTSDVEDLMQEFHEKISQICSKSQDNFILKMYDGKVEIAAMAPYNRSDYYRESLSELAETVEDRIDSCYDNGSAFLRDLKLIIAQIAAKDWTSIDSKRVAVIVDILRRNLVSAVHMGCLSTNANEELQALVNFDTQEEVQDFPVVLGDLSCDIKDTGLYLTPSNDSSISVTVRDVLSQTRSRLEMVLARKGSDLEVWHSMFENFLEALAERRHERVQQWISSNTMDFRDNDEVQRLQLEANVSLGKVKQGLSVCGCKCSECFWRCVLEKGHRDDHSCMGNHSCAESCSYCSREGESLNVCRDLAGHEGSHDCKEKNHTCRETCYLFEVTSNCNELCSLRPEHPGQHKCNSPQHMCNTKCALPSCNNPCAVAIESNHTKHQCHERYCPRKCVINGCSRTCGVKDHFHDWNPDAEHLCGNEHACPNECEMPGICEIFTELVRQTRVFQGQRGSFEYELVSEQNGLRKGCCIPIPPFERDHQGPHVHTKNTDSMHYCDSRCQSCGYFCQLPIDHSGLHDTVHGNMRNVKFISEGEDIEIQDRKYKWGERGEAEMCNMYCKKQGRGHIHLVPCPGSKCTSNLYDGSRHETVKYGPDVDIPKDEMTHETFWQYVRFVDPCTEEEREEFGCCNYYCKSEEHETEAGSSDKSYCTEELWHPPIKSSGPNLSSAGYITDDGHHFGCDHSKNVPHHVIFVIDRSGSMGSSDTSPTLAKFNSHDCRLGCVYEAILRFIQARLRTVSDDSVSVVLFDTSATVAVEMEDMEEGIVDHLLQYCGGGGTTYSEGLDAAEKILIKGARHHVVDVKKPVVIFLSDGGNNGGGDPLYYVDKMKRQEARMTLHTIMFGSDPTMHILIEMAKKGGGTFEQTLDEIQLARSFENLAESLKPQVAALM